MIYTYSHIALTPNLQVCLFFGHPRKRDLPCNALALPMTYISTTDALLLTHQTAELAKLLYFESSKDESGTLCSLDDYVGRLEPEQKEIYYLMAPNRDLAGVYVCVFNLFFAL